MVDTCREKKTGMAEEYSNYQVRLDVFNCTYFVLCSDCINYMLCSPPTYPWKLLKKKKNIYILQPSFNCK